ncbi:MAG: preprotein translocase subunit YajC [Anaerolineaceae bacterium]|nr:preprotein translocase subunit YajC [Anaerolineaceae bacterium]
MQEFALLALVMLLGLGAYWAMVLFPKQRTFQKRQRVVRELTEGDEVITYGGIIGKVARIEAEQGIAYLEIAEGVTIRVIVAALMQPYDPEEIARAAQTGAEAAPDES